MDSPTVFEAASDTAAPGNLERDGYWVTPPAPAVEYAGGTNALDGSGTAVRWPFPLQVPIASGFGARHVAECSFCSTFHQGVNFDPGAGAPIGAIADGIVSRVDEGSGGLGYNAWIDHLIGGPHISSVYGHMRAGSVAVRQGQVVKASQTVGLVGSTANSTGAHLHLEIYIDGAPVDPLQWLRANAGPE